MRHKWWNDPKDDNNNHVYYKAHVILLWRCRNCGKVTWNVNEPKTSVEDDCPGEKGADHDDI